MFISAVQWSKSAVCIPTSPSSWTSLPPLPSISLGHHRDRAELPVLYSVFSLSLVQFSCSVVSDSATPWTAALFYYIYYFTHSSVYVWRRQWQPTPVLLPGKSHGWRSLVGCSPWGCYESGTTEQLHFHFSLFCIGEGNGNPLQCSCLENPRDREAWWASVYGVT